MERLIDILEAVQPDGDHKNCTILIDDHILNSLAIIAKAAKIEDEYDTTVLTVEMIPYNFKSAETFYDRITCLQEEG